MYFALLKKRMHRRNEKQTNKQTNKPKKKSKQIETTQFETKHTNFVLLQWELLFYMIILKSTIDR